MTGGVSEQPASQFRLVDGAMSVSADQLRDLTARAQRFLLEYEFGLREMETKIAILQHEFEHMHEYNPIEHVSSRIKSPESIQAKLARLQVDRDLESIRANVTDIAGVRVTCSFARDAYHIFELLSRQDDITVRRVSDYIVEPKPNGYKSLHAIVEIPVFLSSGVVDVPVEIQLRTIAMDFWASLEHKIYYKYDGAVPQRLLDELKEAADTASELDARMERLHREVHGTDSPATRRDS